MNIKDYPFSLEGIQQISKKDIHNSNWPIVYILNDNERTYIGETSNAFSRMEQHLNDPRRNGLSNIHIIYDEEFNKSATLHIESLLIEYMSSDQRFKKILNGNNGQRHEYFQREHYEGKFTEIWNKLKKMDLAVNEISTIRNQDIFKYSPYKSLTPDQYSVALSLVNDIFVKTKLKSSKSYIINGGAGTGKSILAIYLMKLFKDFSVNNLERLLEDDIEYYSEIASFFANHDMSIGLVIPMQSLRKTIQKIFKQIDGLNKAMVLSPNDVPKKEGKFDILIVDEAHRLRRRKNIVNHKSFMQNNALLGLDDSGDELDWIMMKSNYQILFYDINQSVKPTDISSSRLQSIIDKSDTEVYTLESQMRVEAGKDYIDYINNILNCTVTEKISFDNYEFKLFDNFSDLVKIINEKDSQFGLARLVAGYSWKWVSKSDDSQYDINIQGINYKWNTTDQDWVNSKNAINEIGCIHTVQGYDLNYAGIIFGNEIGYNKELNRIVVYKENYFDINGKKGTDEADLLEYIKNIYKTILTRGIKGTYVYVCNDNLRDYLKQYINQ